MEKRIKLALCGSHAHAEKFGRMINSYPESETVAVWDEDPAKARAVAQALNCRAEESLDELLAGRSLTGAVISILNDQHRRLAVKAAEAGKNIFLEKPLAISLADAYAIRDAVKASGVKFFMTDPFVNASTTYIRSFIRSGKLGRLLSVRVRLCNNISILEALPEEAVREKARRMGGGTMSDTGGHPLHILNYLLGNPERVHARFAYANEARRDYGCEEYITMLMEYPDGLTAVVEAGNIASPYANCIEACGTMGTIVETGLGDRSGEVRYRLCQVREEEFGGPNLREAAARGEWVAVSSGELGPDPDDHIRYFVRMQAEDISNDQVGVDPRSTHGTSIDTAVELMELREKIYQAARHTKM